MAYSVFLPPLKLEFPCDNLDWIKNEADEVRDQAELLYSEIFNAISEISDKWSELESLEDNMNDCGLRGYIIELEKILNKEKHEFEESLQKALQMNRHAATDILEINKLRRYLLTQSYVWDQRLIHTSNLDEKIIQHDRSMLRSMEEIFNDIAKINDESLDAVRDYNPVFISSLCEKERQGGARLLLPMGVNDIVIPVYEDEPTSIIAYALASTNYQARMSDDPEMKGIASELSFSNGGPLGNVSYTVTIYYPKQFEDLRKLSCPSEIDYIRSLSRCQKWGPQEGKSNVLFTKTLDDRLIIKQVMKTELESFDKFAPAYFQYLSEFISNLSATCLAKILGAYQVTSKHVKGGSESKMYVLVMENLLFQRDVIRLYELNASCKSQHGADSSGANKILPNQNSIETMPTPISVKNKEHRFFQRAVWNDTSFLGSIELMDYSLLVGIDEQRYELVVGITDYTTQYTWYKHLVTWVKASRVFGGPKKESITSPVEYRKWFRKAIRKYFLKDSDECSGLSITASETMSDHEEESL